MDPAAKKLAKETYGEKTYANDKTDSLYLQQIEKYRQEKWYDELLENPWLRSKHNDYERGLFEWTDAGENAYYEGLRSNQEQWLSDKLAGFHQQEYDSASEQAKRMAAAGINPDLSGNVTPGQPAENDQPIQGSPIEAAQAIGQETQKTAMTIIGSILSFATGMQNLSAGRFARIADEIRTNVSARDYVLNDIVKSLELDPDKWKEGFSKEELANLIPPAKKIEKLPFSPATRKILTRYYNKLSDQNSLEFEQLYSQVRRQIMENNQAGVEIGGNSLYSPNFKEWMTNYAKAIGNVKMTTMRAAMIAQSAQYNYEKDYYEGLDAEQAAEATNAEAGARTAKGNYDKEFFEGLDAKEAAHARNLLATKEGFQFFCEKVQMETYAKIYKDLDEKNEWWSGIAILELEPSVKGIGNLLESLPSKLADVGLEYLTPENTKGDKKEKSGNGLGAGDMAILSKLAKTKVDGKTLAKIAGAVAKKAL